MPTHAFNPLCPFSHTHTKKGLVIYSLSFNTRTHPLYTQKYYPHILPGIPHIPQHHPSSRQPQHLFAQLSVNIYSSNCQPRSLTHGSNFPSQRVALIHATGQLSIRSSIHQSPSPPGTQFISWRFFFIHSVFQHSTVPLINFYPTVLNTMNASTPNTLVYFYLHVSLRSMAKLFCPLSYYKFIYIPHHYTSTTIAKTLQEATYFYHLMCLRFMAEHFFSAHSPFQLHTLHWSTSDPPAHHHQILILCHNTLQFSFTPGLKCTYVESRF